MTGRIIVHLQLTSGASVKRRINVMETCEYGFQLQRICPQGADNVIMIEFRRSANFVVLFLILHPRDHESKRKAKVNVCLCLANAVPSLTHSVPML
jgi:hypothetical protein